LRARHARTFLAAALASVSLELVLDLEFEFCGWEL